MKKTVNSPHHDLVDQVMSGEREDRESARSKLKKLYLEEFKARSTPGDEFFKGFYAVAKVISKILFN